jgi:hypothetical protein
MARAFPKPAVIRRATVMDREQKAFRAMLDNELKDQHGKFVVIILDALLGVYDTYNDAASAGYRACGFTPFLLKRTPAYAPAAEPAMASASVELERQLEAA